MLELVCEQYQIVAVINSKKTSRLLAQFKGVKKPVKHISAWRAKLTIKAG